MNPLELKAAIQRLRADFPELDQDEQLLFDTLEGETDFVRVVDALLFQRREAIIIEAGCLSLVGDLETRAGRAALKRQMIEDMLLSIIKAAGVGKVVRPDATLSIRKGSKRVEVDDVAALHQPYYRDKREADKTAIRKALDEGLKVPGCRLVTGEDALAVKST